tara:strand:+ start:39 stop:365 length:327 start_codon:yes stop_codon:yes gene_type:complete
VEKDLTYKPLPSCVTIKHSGIDGLGLFAQEDITSGYVFGVSHISDQRFQDGYIRTPLGGFINHSDDPNAILEPVTNNVNMKVLVAIRDISKGEEVTTKYTLYNIQENK